MVMVGALEGMLGMQLMRMMEQNPSTQTSTTQTSQNVVADTPVEVESSEKKKK